MHLVYIPNQILYEKYPHLALSPPDAAYRGLPITSQPAARDSARHALTPNNTRRRAAPRFGPQTSALTCSHGLARHPHCSAAGPCTISIESMMILKVPGMRRGVPWACGAAGEKWTAPVSLPTTRLAFPHCTHKPPPLPSRTCSRNPSRHASIYPLHPCITSNCELVHASPSVHTQSTPEFLQPGAIKCILPSSLPYDCCHALLICWIPGAPTPYQLLLLPYSCRTPVVPPLLPAHGYSSISSSTPASCDSSAPSLSREAALLPLRRLLRLKRLL